MIVSKSLSAAAVVVGLTIVGATSAQQPLNGAV